MLTISVPVVAPLILPALLNGTKFFNHVSAGVGVPVAPEMKVAVVPPTLVRLCGLGLITGPSACTVRVATALVTEPNWLVTTTS